MNLAQNPLATPPGNFSFLMNSIEDGGYDSPSSSSGLDTTGLTRAVVVGLLMTTGLLTLTWGFLATVRF